MGSIVDQETTDVVICGCGPTGAMLSVLLGQRGIRNIVLEREPDITTDPRGIALDEDGIRYLQACGIYKEIFADIGQCMGKFMFVGGAHHDLSTKPFLAMNYTTTEGGTGHPGFMCHKQPSIEKHLRSQIQQLPTSDLRVSSTLTGIREDKDWVYVTYNDSRRKEHQLRSKFLVGADGKTGHTRKNYLEPRGIRLEKAHQTSYEEVWVALNWKVSLPTPQSHPDFPLWAKGFSPRDVYDLFFPKDFRFLCNPDRAAVCGRFGLKEDRLWRFEYVVLPGEDGDEMAKPGKMREVVFPYITHPGSRYNLAVKTIQYPSDCIEVLRCRPFKFSARSCNQWALDRVVLCGDAAHVFPPFGGQGIASGFRDAISLSWRLVLACQGAPNFRLLLQGWYSERKQQLDMSLASTVENGDYVTESNRWRIFLRDWYLWLLQLVPTWKHWLEMGNRRDGMTRYKWEEGKGMAFLHAMGGGGNFPQVYCVCINDHRHENRVQFTDDVIFARGKSGLFQLVIILPAVQDLPFAQTAVAGIEEVSHGTLRPDEVTFIVNSTKSPSQKLDANQRVFRLATAGEFAADEKLCSGRPQPQHYDPYRLSKEVHNSRFVILRPDRFVFAACTTQGDLFQAASQIARLGQISL